MGALVIGSLMSALLGQNGADAASEPRVAPTAPGSKRLPPELVSAIDTAFVIVRQAHGPDEDPRIVVSVPVLGRWMWRGAEHATERVGRFFPELDDASCERAAMLISGQVTMRLREQPKLRRRSSWVWED